MPGEFELISRYFSQHDSAPGVSIGIGDDCAVLSHDPGFETVITTDTLNEGVHFFPGTDPFLLGRQTVRVNASDLAAMGARPWVCTLSLTLPVADDGFLEAYAKGFFSAAKDCGLSLIGGNTTRGPLSFTLTALGRCQQGRYLTRSAALAGDLIFVTGDLGLCGLYLKYHEKNPRDPITSSLESEYFTGLGRIRTDFAAELCEKGLSRCAIDLSDGIAGDLKHVLSGSAVGAEINIEALPYHPALAGLSSDERIELCLSAGGDYELLFTVSMCHEQEVIKLAQKLRLPVTCIGQIMPHGLIYRQNGRIVSLLHDGYQHF